MISQTPHLLVASRQNNPDLTITCPFINQLVVLVFTNRGVSPHSWANSGGHGLHRPGGAGRVPRDGPEEAEGRGSLQARQAGAHISKATVGHSVEGAPRGEVDLGEIECACTEDGKLE